MHTKKSLAILSLMLCLVIGLSACTFPFGSSKNGGNNGSKEPHEMRTINFNDIEYARVDFDALSAQMSGLVESAAKAESYAELSGYIDEFDTLMSDFNTKHTYVWLRAKQDVNDTYFEDEMRWMDEVDSDIQLIWADFYKAVIGGKFARDYRKEVGDHYFKEVENQTLMYSESVLEYKKERAAIETDYDKALSTFEIEHEGKSYTFEDIYDVDSENLRLQLSDIYYNEHVETYTDMLARLVELDKLTAEELGFNDPATMYYIRYSRDYTPKDALAIIDNVKEYFMQILPLVFYNQYKAGSASLDETMTALPAMLANVDPQLEEIWDFMLEYDLYDVEARKNKNTGNQFTTTLTAYDAPYIFTYWRDNFSSATTIIHEFGHYSDSYLRLGVDNVSSSLDIAEVYSQGLELLMEPFYGEITDDPEAAMLDNLQSTLFSGIIYQSMLEEFQLQLYQMDTFDSVVIGRLYADLAFDYYMQSELDEYGADNSWIGVPHIFLSPFYTISYVTSAIAALQIWTIAQDDWRAGADTYLALLREDQNQPFTELLKNAGLKPVQSEDAVIEIAQQYIDTFLAYIDLDEIYGEGEDEDDGTGEDESALPDAA